MEKELVPISKGSDWALGTTPIAGAEVSQVRGAELGRKQGWQACPWGKEAGSTVKSLWLNSKRVGLPVQETWVRSLDWDDPLLQGYPLQYSCLEGYSP